MGSYVSTPQTSPQLLGISFIENYRFYFQDDKHLNTTDVSNTVKNAFRQQKVAGEVMSIIRDSGAADISKVDIIKKLHDILEKYPGDPNVSRLAYDLSQVKIKLLSAEQRTDDLNRQILEKLNGRNSSNSSFAAYCDRDYQEFVQKIKELKHNKRELERQLESSRKQYDEIQVSILAARRSIQLLQEENKILDGEINVARIENIEFRKDISLVQIRLNHLLLQIDALSSQLLEKNNEIINLQEIISSKDEELREALLSIINSSTDLDGLLDLIIQLEEQLFFRANEIRASAEMLDETEATFVSLEEKLTLLADTFQAQISQLEAENVQLRQRLGI